MTTNMSKVLMISIDQSILDENSKTFARMKEYATLTDELHVLVLEKGAKKQQGNLYVYGTSNYVAACSLAKQLHQEKKFDCVTTQDPFLTGSIGRMLKKKYNVKLNVQLHGDFFSPYFKKESLKNRFFVHFFHRHLLPYVDSFRVVSERLRQGLVTWGVPDAKIIVAPIYVDPNFYAVDKITHDGFKILFIGSRVKVKNLPLLVKAVRELAKQFREVELIIKSGGQEDIRPSLAEADCLVLPSFHEGYGRVIIESFAAGVPVVMSDVGLAGWILKDNINGLVFKVNDLEDLVSKLSSLAANPALRGHLAKNAKETLKTLPSKQEILNRIKLSWS